jgi:hypothetical protein
VWRQLDNNAETSEHDNSEGGGFLIDTATLLDQSRKELRELLREAFKKPGGNWY